MEVSTDSRRVLSGIIHREDCSDSVAWSTMNAGEALPGVATPLTWSFFGDAAERAFKNTFADIGVLKRSEVVAAPRAEDRLWDIFYGRAAANLDTFRMLGDRMPGTSGDAIEEQIFGQVREGVESKSEYGRYPVVAAKMPWAMVHLRRRLARQTAPIERWWRESAFDLESQSEAAARAILQLAAERFEAVMRPHTLAAMVCQSIYDQLHGLAELAGRPGLELRLVTGYGGMAETKLVADLWDVSRGRLELDEFVARYGYHGPDEGELAARVWRIDRSPLEALVESYRERGEEDDPRRVEAARAAERARAEREILDALPVHRRPAARVVMWLAGRFIPLRGTGKAAFLRCTDVARAAARVIGARFERQGVLEDAEDAFMFTLDELLGEELPEGAAELARARREAYERFRGLDVPDLFYGVPEPIPLEEPGGGGRGDGVVTGTPVSPGVVEGAARVVLDPSESSFEPGEILVCRTTDPSWASLMVLADALVIDIGGPISHGAIVARELGIPCVIGTRDGTAKIKTGDQLRVDGERGEVVIVDP